MSCENGNGNLEKNKWSLQTMLSLVSLYMSHSKVEKHHQSEKEFEPLQSTAVQTQIREPLTKGEQTSVTQNVCLVSAIFLAFKRFTNPLERVW